MSGTDPTPWAVRRSAAREFGESWLSPGVQKYLGSSFATPGGAPGSAEPHSMAQPSADARLHATLAALQRKDDVGAGGAGFGSTLSGTAAYSDRIPAYQPGAAPPASGPSAAPASTAPASAAAAGAMGDALAADFRQQLQRYAAQLAAKEGEVAALRQANAELRQAAAAADSRAQHAGEQLSRHAAAAGQLEEGTAVLERQLADREAELMAAGQARRAAEQAAAAARAQATAAQKAAAGRTAEFEAERRHFREQLERREEELHR